MGLGDGHAKQRVGLLGDLIAVSPYLHIDTIITQQHSTVLELEAKHIKNDFGGTTLHGTRGRTTSYTPLLLTGVFGKIWGCTSTVLLLISLDL